MTHQFDCNTVGPVPVASGYGSSMLTHSAAYMLRDGNTHASALSSGHEKIRIQDGDNDLRELSETIVGVPETQIRPSACLILAVSVVAQFL